MRKCYRSEFERLRSAVGRPATRRRAEKGPAWERGDGEKEEARTVVLTRSETLRRRRLVTAGTERATAAETRRQDTRTALLTPITAKSRSSAAAPTALAAGRVEGHGQVKVAASGGAVVATLNRLSIVTQSPDARTERYTKSTLSSAHASSCLKAKWICLPVNFE